MAASVVYNRAEALERLGGDEAFFDNVAALFVAESATYCRALEDALAAADVAAVQREAHTVKSMLATFSYEEGRELAMRLEYLAAAGSLEGAQSLTAEVLGAVRALADTLGKTSSAA